MLTFSGVEVGESVHIPVMLAEVLEGLNATKGGRFLDCTLGGGGHTRAILDSNPSNQVYAIDRDVVAVERAEKELEKEISTGRLVVKHSAFSGLEFCEGLGEFDGVLADLGISSDQLGDKRGFSFNDTGALDMRMDMTATRSAKEVVNETSEQELYAILKKGGVGVEARAVAHEIVKARPLTTTAELASAVHRGATGKTNKGFDSATVTFQAIRIEVNQELNEIKRLLGIVPSLLKVAGRLVVISFHSLEDKIVAKQMRDWTSPSSAPANWPGLKSVKPLGKLLTKKALFPSEEEIARNSRSRSARLRIFEKAF